MMADPPQMEYCLAKSGMRSVRPDMDDICLALKIGFEPRLVIIVLLLRLRASTREDMELPTIGPLGKPIAGIDIDLVLRLSDSESSEDAVEKVAGP